MTADPNRSEPIEGQLSARERELLTQAILGAPRPPRVALEVGTWLGGGSTLHILRALEKNGCGHLWGIEADRTIYERMIANLKAGAPEALHRFTPLFGLSQQVIPQWLAEQPRDFEVDFAFLDGGNNPLEQITEFRLVENRVPVGGQIMAHDAKFRKAKWLVPFISRCDNWRTQIYDVSAEGLLHSVKTAPRPSPSSLNAARRCLFKLRLQPMEVVAALLPSTFCGLICRLIPPKVLLRLFAGVNADSGK
jgi:predicted O-methyltransferase YrrM